MRYTALCLLVVVASVHAPAALATDNEPPVVDAGLDQSVAVGATVYLDAGGSYDPDGDIRGYEWTVRGPNGTRLSPDCPTCERTSFAPDDPGTYAVTVRATDDDGATRTDTLYVDARPGSGPTVTLSAPASATAGDSVSVTAAVDAGTASLDELRWRVNGVAFGTEDLDGGSATVSRAVPIAGGGSITVRAVVVDNAGLRATASTRIDVSAPSDDGAGASGDPPRTNDSVTNGTAPTPENDTATGSSASMTVRGPTLLTGERPLRGTYSLSIDGGDAAIRSIGWYVDGELAGGGPTTTITFDPGRHDLIARVLTDDGGRTVAFSDGTTEVVADPAPTVAFEQVSLDGTRVTGRVSAIDLYGTLEEFHVAIDGTHIADSFDDGPATTPVRGSIRSLPFEHSLAPNESYELSVTAVDDRGQTHRITRTITTGSDAANTSQSEGEEPDPTIVSAEFVNAPVDSYHEQIATDRYLAEHVTRIDLDGADPAAVELSPKQMGNSIRHFPDRTRKRYDELDDTLAVRSYFAGENPGEYEVVLSLADDGTSADRDASTFLVIPSKPEPRLDIARSGTDPDAQNWGMVVDASESFDPDGLGLKFEWNGGANELDRRGVAKFDSRDRASLVLKDSEGLSTTIDGEFLDYFNPGIETIERASTDTSTEEGDVYFRVSTPVYAFTKHNYDADLSISIAGDGRVVEWRNEEASLEGGGADSPGSTEDSLEQRYTGLIAIDRDEFEDGSVEVNIYNDAQPETTAMSYSATLTEEYARETFSRRDLTIEDVQYEVETERNQRIVTPKPDKREEYEDRGYVIIEERQDAIAYEVERARERRTIETERRTFESERTRRRFLRTINEEWRPTGTETTTERRRVTETVWRSSKGGPGTFTGRTKQVLPPDASMTTEREYIVRMNKTITVTEEIIVPTPVGQRTVEITRERTVTRERTYWAKTPESRAHARTGATRQGPADGALETRYEYEVEKHEKKEVRRYVVERTVSQRETVWRDDGTVSATSSERQRIKSDENMRITDTEHRTEWVLERNESRKTVVNEYRDEDDVTQTIVYVSGDLVQRNATDESTEVVAEFEDRIKFHGVPSRAEIREMLDRRAGETECSGKDPITSECGGYKNG